MLSAAWFPTIYNIQGVLQAEFYKDMAIQWRSTERVKEYHLHYIITLSSDIKTLKSSIVIMIPDIGSYGYY